MVAARETSLQPILEGSKQYRVPLYQRPYQWGKAQRQTLWSDLVQLAEDRREDPTASHFMGSVVLAPSPGDVSSVFVHHLVVDGQQRLTTLTLLLSAIRDAYRRDDHASVDAERIQNTLLTNQYSRGDDHLKLLPTQADRTPYQSIVIRDGSQASDDEVGEAYRYFAGRLESLGSGGDSTLTLGEIEQAVTSGLSIVLIQTEAGDNVHRIFESLNNTGLKLSQADLIRNYLFMRMPEQGEYVYEHLWKPLQDLLPGDDLGTFFWLDLVSENPRAKVNDTYSGQQRRLDNLASEADVVAEMERFHARGKLYRLIRHPEEERDPSVRLRLRRMDAWGSATPAPLLMHLLGEREAGRATSDDVAGAMHIVESYIVRRFLSATRSQGMNRIFAQAVTELDADLPLADAVRTYLSAGRKHFATDPQVRASVVNSPFYLNGRAAHRKLVLIWLEEAFGSNEPVDLGGASIEHIMPQTLSSDWVDSLTGIVGEGEVDDTHIRWVHTLGNLTLTGYNSSMSNRSFPLKRDELDRSGIRLSRGVSKSESWGPAEIEERANYLADRVIAYWPGPDDQGVAETSELWGKLHAVLAELPAGHWTTYGDLAAVLGTAAQPVGNHLATTAAPNAHRVLKRNGVVSDSFVWVDPQDGRDPVVLLRDEGVRFDGRGRADTDQRLTLEQLAGLADDEVGDE
ncbi:GmrSD restriction endonuclease domain-containing protein [Tsukamurella paurometabola]|uniref:DUF262 domain-containing protein n=1 Tax=Tsukamurella paurometabola TaxID=2061 RepID=A0ABS5NJR7_TSUPA|nr:DUF262 domain-containing protein [Tsukamurella paurometabola]MBS4104260.1 DUF262 domain-containing protein [Tsukamurella paurometabola]